MKKLLAVAAVCVTLSSGAAHAMTGAQFHAIENMPDSLSVHHKLLQPLTTSYIQTGCKRVPDWYNLSLRMNVMIRKYGLAEDDASQIAWKAAHTLGMNCERR